MNNLDENLDALGDNHIGTSVETPLRPDAFDKSDDQKIEEISFHFKKINTKFCLQTNRLFNFSIDN